MVVKEINMTVNILIALSGKIVGIVIFNCVVVCLQHSGVNSSKKKLWKNLKQILTIERSQQWKEDDPTCKFVLKLFPCYH